MKILNAAQMRHIDRLTTERYGVPSILLMENAGLTIYLTLRHLFPKLENKRIAVVCGKGNNGGDGLVAARQLAQRGIQAEVFLLGKREEVSGDARANLEIYLHHGWPIHWIPSPEEWAPAQSRLEGFQVIVDALLGTGIRPPVTGFFEQVIEDLNACRAFRLSVDIPSGMSTDALQGGGPTVRADATITFTAPKIAHLLNPDQEALGEVRVAPIGTPWEVVQSSDSYLELITWEKAWTFLGLRRRSSHKGDFGHAVIVAGSRGKSGAGVLSAWAALRAGTGLVTLCVPEPSQATAAGFHPELMTESFAATEAGSFDRAALERLLPFLESKDAAGIGPGITTEPDTVQLTTDLVQQSPIPLVLDADALNAFAGRVEELKNLEERPLVLTPHPGEFARLLARPVPEVLRGQLELTRDFARSHGVWLVLKTFRTLVATPDGRVYVCPRGNPGMATAGMGDALTGILTAFVARAGARHRGSAPPATLITQAVQSGVYLHALAGDLAVQQWGEPALTAGDVIATLGQAILHLEQIALNPPSRHVGILLQ